MSLHDFQKVIRVRPDGGSFLLAGDPLRNGDSALDGGALPVLLGRGWRVESVHMAPGGGADSLAAMVVLRRMAQAGQLAPGEIQSEQGHCYTARVGEDTGGDDNERPRVSILRLFEDDRELGPAHTVHAEVRDRGQGRFSHWHYQLYFSSSDNSDPRTNGRTYTWRVEPGREPEPVPARARGTIY